MVHFIPQCLLQYPREKEPEYSGRITLPELVDVAITSRACNDPGREEIEGESGRRPWCRSEFFLGLKRRAEVRTLYRAKCRGEKKTVTDVTSCDLCDMLKHCGRMWIESIVSLLAISLLVSYLGLGLTVLKDTKFLLLLDWLSNIKARSPRLAPELIMTCFAAARASPWYLAPKRAQIFPLLLTAVIRCF